MSLYTEQQISDLTAFDQGDVFESEAQVRDYFTPNNMTLMFGDDSRAQDLRGDDRQWRAPSRTLWENLSENQLDAMADAVIEHRWHCEF